MQKIENTHKRKQFILSSVIVSLHEIDYGMKKFFLTAFIASSLFASAQVNMPQPSPTQRLKQDFGMGEIVLTYSRPSLKDRTVFGNNSELAPLGKLWRTGANAATRLHFNDFVNIGGKDLDSGTYVLYTIPGDKQWTIIINKGIDNWGTDGYTDSADVVRFTVPSHTLNIPPVETFTMGFSNIKFESCDLTLMWDKTVVMVPITTKIKDRLRKQIEDALKNDKKPPYWSAANFYYEWDKDYSKALTNINAAIEKNPDAFWMYLLKAKIEAAQNNKAGAKADALKCKELATAQKNDDYIKQADKLIASL